MLLDPCPHCGFELDDGEIYENLKDNIFYRHLSEEELLKVAQQYGWTKENKKRFTNRVTVKPVDGTPKFVKCPYCNKHLETITS